MQIYQQRLSRAYIVARSRLRPFQTPSPCLAVDKIFARMPVAWRVWKPLISHHPSTHPYTDVDPTVVDLTAWMEKLETSDPLSRSFQIHGLNPATDRYGPAQLHRCSTCNTPSAALKECSRCHKTRYVVDIFIASF